MGLVDQVGPGVFFEAVLLTVGAGAVESAGGKENRPGSSWRSLGTVEGSKGLIGEAEIR